MGLHTVYFGGGTPSLLTKNDIVKIFAALNANFFIDPNAEITLESNPDDLTKEKIAELKSTPINRLSIGIQSFSDMDLQWMNRAHNAEEALTSVKTAQDAGFENITIDLIYGVPTLSDEQWRKNLDTAFSLGVPHISAYCLTVEPRTALADFIKKRKVENTSEEKAACHFEILMDEMEQHRFIQYEISNFSIKGFEAQHNSSYWKGEYYLGLGPSAHSYNGESRQWNVPNNIRYIKALSKNELDFEKEILTPDNKFNEYLLTSLRTLWGCDLKMVSDSFGIEKLNHLMNSSNSHILQGNIISQNDKLFLSKKGKFIADRVVSDLFF